MPRTTLQMAQEAMNLFEGFESPNTMPWRKEAGDVEPGYKYKKNTLIAQKNWKISGVM